MLFNPFKSIISLTPLGCNKKILDFNSTALTKGSSFFGSARVYVSVGARSKKKRE